VNPFGGKKSAREIFVKEVKPLFEDADVQLEIQETKYQLHAKEFVKSMDVSKYDGIVCVSGDGILVEVCKKYTVSLCQLFLDNLNWK
jgi:sphingosine kinase